MSSTEGDDSDGSGAYFSEGDIPCSLTKSDGSESDTESEMMDLEGTDMLLAPFYLQGDEHRNIIANGLSPSAESFILPGEMSHHLQTRHPDIHSNLMQLHGGRGSMVYVPASVTNFHQLSISHPRPNSVLFDAFVFHPSKPIMLLTFSTHTKPRVSRYNASVTRAAMMLVTSNLQDTTTFVRGVIDTATWECKTLFAETIREFETSAETFSVPISLQMNENKCRSAIKVLLNIDSSQVNSEGEPEEQRPSAGMPVCLAENSNTFSDVLRRGILTFFGKAVRQNIFEGLFPYAEKS
ncbi:uncharacterized protein [Haliotis cracherodii]|uniref:uncharacterized protein n=1 Tax=Haliotis cracherodii TaxID=6455 RepID=UPI0039ECB4C5